MAISPTSESAVTGKAKVLVIANPDIASAVYEALEPYAHFPARQTTTVESAKQTNTYTVSWLFSQIFPMPNDSPRQGVFKWVLHTFKNVWSRGDDDGHESVPAFDSSTSLFKWGDFDFVIIQDLWPAEHGKVQHLECAGYVLANLDYYLWGNFGTKKVILVTDPDFLDQKADWIRRGMASPEQQQSVVDVLHEFDQKDAFELVQLNGDGADPVKRLIQIVRHHDDHDRPREEVSKSTVAGQKIFHDLMKPVVDEAVEALRLYVNEQADIVIIDDEYGDLVNTFEMVAGKDFKVKQDPEEQNAGQVIVTKVSEGIASEFTTFERLVEHCVGEFQRSTGNEKRYTLYVTDILFKGPSWHETGLDLIEKLRQRLDNLEDTRRVGIVAFTSFTTPFIAMSSYQRGADFIVAKSDYGAHDLKITGTQRLLMTLAFLCFQKSFLSEKRREAGRIIGLTKSVDAIRGRNQNFRSLSELQAVLPKHTVSIHLQPEWLDTCYLFEAIDVYGPSSDKIKIIHQEISDKYD